MQKATGFIFSFLLIIKPLIQQPYIQNCHRHNPSWRRRKMAMQIFSSSTHFLCGSTRRKVFGQSIFPHSLTHSFVLKRWIMREEKPTQQFTAHYIRGFRIMVFGLLAKFFLFSPSFCFFKWQLGKFVCGLRLTENVDNLIVAIDLRCIRFSLDSILCILFLFPLCIELCLAPYVYRENYLLPPQNWIR
jgi:hypothetical protein